MDALFSMLRLNALFKWARKNRKIAKDSTYQLREIPAKHEFDVTLSTLLTG